MTRTISTAHRRTRSSAAIQPSASSGHGTAPPSTPTCFVGSVGMAVGASRISPAELKDVAQRAPELIPPVPPTIPTDQQPPMVADLENITRAEVEQVVRAYAPGLPDDEVARMVDGIMASIAAYLDPASASTRQSGTGDAGTARATRQDGAAAARLGHPRARRGTAPALMAVSAASRAARAAELRPAVRSRVELVRRPQRRGAL